MESVRQALDTWQATDLTRIADAQGLLENAVDHLRNAARELERNPHESPRELRELAAVLRRDVSRVARVVDACTAFQNGLAVRIGAAGVAYQPSGAAAPPPVSNGPRGIEA